jgi:hypothetical protein
MTRYRSEDVAFLLFGGYNLLAHTQAVESIDKEAIIEETGVLGATLEEHTAVGIKRGNKLILRGFYDDAALSVNAALVTVGGSKVACIGLETNNDNKRFIGWAGAITGKYSRKPVRGGLTKYEAEFQVSGDVEDGRIVQRLFTITVDPYISGTAIDNGTSSANGGAGYLQVTALTLGGFTNIIHKIRHSTDNSVYVDLITFTAVTAAPAAERKTVAGTINRYTRAEYDFTGAGSGQSNTLMLGLVRN